MCYRLYLYLLFYTNFSAFTTFGDSVMTRQNKENQKLTKIMTDFGDRYFMLEP